MCGIVFFKGSNAHFKIKKSLDKIRHRGPDDQQVFYHSDMALGFNRLIVHGDEIIGKQPFIQNELIACINGEIYNHDELSRKWNIETDPNTDLQVILPLFIKNNVSFVKELDGFYAGLIINLKDKKAYLFRDFIGKKPLFYGYSDGDFFITSELKAIKQIDTFKIAPKGVLIFDLNTGESLEIINNDKHIETDNLKKVLIDAVKKRLPPASQPVGLFLSGGLDSSIIASIASSYRKDIVCFILYSPESTDRPNALEVARYLNLNNIHEVLIPDGDLLDRYIKHLVYVTESYNPSVISNGLATFLLSEAAQRHGIKVILSGEGADELFGGYDEFLSENELIKRREQLLSDMHFTELRRLDLCSMSHSIEARCPFLDKKVMASSLMLGHDEIYKNGENKVILRALFQGALPENIIHRKKMSFDVGSGVRKAVVEHLKQYGDDEKTVLKEMWLNYFTQYPDDPYFHSYPAFDDLIAKRGIMHK